MAADEGPPESLVWGSRVDVSTSPPEFRRTLLVEPTYELIASTGGRALWPVATLALQLASWTSFILTQGYGDHLVERWGPAPDVVDALNRDAYVSRCTLPYYSAVLLLDGAAALTLAVRSHRGWSFGLKILTGVLLLPTAALHGLVWLLCVFFVA